MLWQKKLSLKILKIEAAEQVFGGLKLADFLVKIPWQVFEWNEEMCLGEGQNKYLATCERFSSKNMITHRQPSEKNKMLKIGGW